jgi:integrase
LPRRLATQAGGPGPDRLLFTNSAGRATRRNAFSALWSKSAAEAETGATCHSLRHFYASLLIRHGESVKTVQRRLGHKSATETLDTYGHLWPDTDDRTREAVDLAVVKPADS